MRFKAGRVLIISCFLFGAFQLKAQNSGQRVPAKDLIRLRSVEAEVISSPNYSVDIRSTSVSRDGLRKWLRVQAEYDTAKEWTDQITFTFYVVLKGDKDDLPEGAPELNMFSGTVTVVNVPESRQAVTSMFLDPFTLARYGEVTNVAVVININGELAAGMAEPSSSAQSQWWTKMSPNQTQLLNISDTPYMLVEIDKQFNIQK